ncbi:MAG: molybdopterin-dependent oxidoreductase [Phycisphaerae bacterium]|nr:molybdopterin-dependent oxidoreductase [Phycisphaerae bacterium]
MSDPDVHGEQANRIVVSRMALRKRFLKRMEQTPASADERPLGLGPPNRHGMPQLPPDQVATEGGKWPVLDLGEQPQISREDWHLSVDGACSQPVTLDWAGLSELEQVEMQSDFHCVTRWSRLDIPWVGVPLAAVIALAEPLDEATCVMCHGSDGYSTNIPLAEALKDDVLLAHTADGGPLPREHGGPVRVITPQLWAWKGAKWISRIELMLEDRPGFWEQRGYSNTAHPWRNDRYSEGGEGSGSG